MKPFLLFLAALLSATTAHGGDIATERTQAATGAIIGMIQQINGKIQEATETIQLIEDTANAADPRNHYLQHTGKDLSYSRAANE